MFPVRQELPGNVRNKHGKALHFQTDPCDTEKPDTWIERKRVARVVYHAVIVVRRLNQSDRKDVRRDPDLIKRKIGGWAKRIETGNVHSNQIKIEMFIQHFNIGVQIIIGKTADFQTDSTYFFKQRN